MFDNIIGALWEVCCDFTGWIWQYIFAPLWKIIRSWWVYLLGIGTAFVDWLVEKWGWFNDQMVGLAQQVDALLSVNQPYVDFGAGHSILGTINYFVPLYEFFALCTFSGLIWGLALGIRLAKWVREVLQ